MILAGAGNVRKKMSEGSDQPERTKIVLSPPSGWDTSSIRGLIEIIREDRKANSTAGLLVPATQMLMVHRLGEWAADQPNPLGAMAMFIFRLLNVYVRNVLGFEVSHKTKIGRRVVFVHQNGVVLQPHAEIGDECWLYHNVTVGRRWEDHRPDSFLEPPKIGKGVQLGVGCTVIGAVHVGDMAKLGPHTVVTTDVPAGASVVAPVSRIMRLRDG
jgi:serine O-acetyltransferase